MSDAYQTDFYAWANEQSALLRAGRLASADIAEEIEGMGRGEKRALVDRLTILLAPLLKWHFQPGFRSSSWSSSMREQRIRLKSRLKVKIDESFAEAYELPVIAATRETGLEEGAFPPASPCGFSQAMDAHFWPE